MTEFFVESFFSLENFTHAEIFADTTYVWEALEKLHLYLAKQKLGKIECEISKEVYLVNPELISIGKGTVIEAGACIQGPCVLGEDCLVRHGAYVRGNVLAGDRCVIGHDTEIKSSILLNGVRASHFNYVGNSILGNDVNLGAGVKCANLRLDRAEVMISSHRGKIATRLKKLGLIAGDGSQLGCNCVTNPGTLLGKGAFCYPCVNIGGYVPHYGKVKLQQQISVEVQE